MNNSLSVALIRGAFANNFELQNYEPLSKKNIQAEVFTSLFPIEKNICLNAHRLISLYDLTRAYKSRLIEKSVRYIANRTFGDAHILLGLEQKLGHYDVLHTADSHYYYSYQAARVKQKYPEKLFISTSWETKPFNNESTPFKKMLKDRVKKCVDIFVCYSRKAQNALLEEHVPAEKIIHIPLGVDTETFTPALKKQHLILFAGRLEKEKDPISVVKAFRIIARQHPQYKLLMLGEGPLKKTLEELVDDYGLGSKVQITTVPYHKMPGIYKKAELFIAPSITTKTWEEQYGMVFVEALSSGLPIITTKSGAIEEVVGSAGLYSRERDYVGLSASLNQLISSSSNMRLFQTRARKRALSQFDRRDFANKIQYIYEKHQRNNHR